MTRGLSRRYEPHRRVKGAFGAWRPYRYISARFATVGFSIALLLAAVPGLASAHTNDDASAEHILIEFGMWGAGIAALIAALVGVLWLRMRFRRDQ